MYYHMVLVAELEPATFLLRKRRSIRLSYRSAMPIGTAPDGWPAVSLHHSELNSQTSALHSNHATTGASASPINATVESPHAQPYPLSNRIFVKVNPDPRLSAAPLTASILTKN